MIVFDIEPLQNDAYKNRGIGRYVRSLISAARTAGVKFNITYNPLLPSPDVNRLSIPERLFPATRANLSAERYDWLVTTSPFEASLGATHRLYRDCFPDGKIATIVYDLIPMAFEMDYLGDSLERTRYSTSIRSLLKSDLLLCISEHTASDLRHYLDPKCNISVIGTGVDDQFFANNGPVDEIRWAELIRRYPLIKDRGYLFTVSGGHKSKNFAALLAAYAACPFTFRQAYPLVVGGGFTSETKAHFEKEWQQLHVSNGTRKTDILILPHLDDGDLRCLYRNTRLFVYSSIYEGFGLPLAEAVTSRAVCISSDRSSLPEIMPLAELQFNPLSIEEITGAIVNGVANRAARERFGAWAEEKADDFRWKHVGTRLAALLPASEEDSRSVGPAKRTAVIGPLPPVRSGIAGYNLGILANLGPNLSWFYSEGFSPVVGHNPAAPLSLYDETWPKFDSTVYVIGNSFHHLPALERLERLGGVVWLHDVRLSGLAWDLARKTRPTDPWSKINELLSTYSVSLPYIDSLEQLEKVVYAFVKPLLANATGFVVHSHHAKEMLIEDFGGISHMPPVVVIPLAIGEQGRVEPKVSHAADAGIRIGLLGFIHPIKSPEAIIQAAGIVVAGGLPATIVVLGQVSDDYAKTLKYLAAQVGVKIEIRGYLEDDQFRKAIRDLDVAVQLRKRTNGESSATVADAIAAGVSVISNIPSVIEMWGDYVIKAEFDATPGRLSELILQSQEKVIYEPHDFEKRKAHLKSYSFPNVAARFERAIIALSSHREAVVV